MATVLNTKFEELCRLCGARADSLAVHIFEDEGTFSELGKKIFSCLQIQASILHLFASLSFIQGDI